MMSMDHYPFASCGGVTLRFQERFLMFGDTVGLTINSVSETLTKINQDGYSSEYLERDSTSELRFKIRHSKVTVKGKSYDRHNVEIIETVFATATEDEFQRKAYFVFETLPKDGNADLMEALGTFADATNLAKLILWES